MMRAILYERYGSPDVLALREVDAPAVGDRDVLVRVRAAGVSAGDCHLLTGTLLAVRLYQGLFRPKRRILGHDVAGVVEAAGARVTRFRKGDAVFGESPDAGTFAELVAVPEDHLVPKPAHVSFEEAAVVPVSALTALQGLRDKGGAGPGRRVLVNGASGGVGTFAVQIAKSLDAEVTGTCRADKADLVRSLGADRVLDYRAEDFTAGPRRYDVVLDLAGKQPLAACRRALAPDGTYVAVAGAPARLLRVALLGGRRMVAFLARPNRADLEVLAGMLEKGTLRPVIDRRFPLAGVPEALRVLGAGDARGKLVVTPEAP